MIIYRVSIETYAEDHKIEKINIQKHREFIKELNEASNENDGYHYGQIHVRYFRTKAEAKTHIKRYPNGAEDGYRYNLGEGCDEE